MEEKRKRARKLVAAEKALQERIVKLHEHLNDSRSDFHLTPEHIVNAVQVALNIAGKPELTAVSKPGLADNVAFDVPPLSGSWAQALTGLNHPHTHEKRPITFDHNAVKGREDIVLAHLNHKLVQMSLRLLREEIWKLDDIKNLQT